MGYFFVTLITYTIHINQLKKDQRDLENELVSLKDHAEDLSTTIQKLKDPDYVARYARENYLYSASGEYIIKIEKKEKEDIKEEKNKKTYPYYIYGSVLCLIGIFLYVLKRK